MISRETETKLSELFLSISYQENEIELSRYDLSKHKDFDPISSFQYLDKLNMNSLSPSDIQSFLEKFHFYCVQSETYSLIRQYDNNKNGRLGYSEFLQLVLPSTNPGFRELALARRGNRSSEVEYLLVKLIQQEILYHRTLESLKRNLVSKADFNLLDCFKAINFRGESSLTRPALTEFLRKFKVVSEQDVDAIFRRLDNDGDSALSYSEFVDAVMPVNRGESPSITGSIRNSSPLRSSPKKDSYKWPSSPSRNLNPYHSSSIERYSPKRHSSPLRKATTVQDHKDLTRAALYQTAKPSYSPVRDMPATYSPDKSLSYLNPANYSRPLTCQNPSLSTSNGIESQKTYEYTNKRTSPSRYSPKKSLYNEKDLSTEPIASSADLREIVIMMQEEIKSHNFIDGIRNNLAIKHDFNLIDAFRIFDSNDNGFITLMDIEQGLGRIGFRPTQDEIYLLVRHYSRLQDSRIRFSDFSEMLTPKQEEYARIMRNKQALNIVGLDRLKVFARDTLAVVVSVFRALFDAEIVAEQQRQKIRRLPGFNLYQVYSAIDKDKNGFVTINEFQKFLENFGVMTSPRDLMVIMQKFDKNNDGRVSYSEFIDEITPKSVQLY